ncbi:MAG TPA: WhiB family transcriptional regulator [Actinophytocola sp.]|uniref:WhiB family transcriptional regulator n=1 Tax=Actinophytocola sp. TaxID=1872138 RepID=UPI002DB88933|nr:WhiB family transcriptional regulator [Actinophytocola sp.]HEU5475686.1 WhiB family transcriptional regulator [Actinophytocola sp.]
MPDWHELAACKLFPELDFIQPGGDGAKPAQRAAAELACRTICAVCPVRLQCAVGALERRERWGIWGGMDYQDRKLVAARFGYEPPGDPPEHGTHSRRVKWGCACVECKAGHALYEALRREKRRAEARARNVWAVPLVLATPLRVGRRLLPAGQLLLPLQVCTF